MTDSSSDDDLSAKETLLPSPFPSLRPKSPHHRTITLSTLLLILLPTSLLTLTLGILIGVHLPHDSSAIRASPTTLPQPPGTSHQIWQHNLTFSQAPTAESEEAWSSIIPVGRGFIHHEELAPFISNIAVFHQLHCLHAILVAYYLALSPPNVTLSNSSLPPTTDPQTHTRTALPHVRHCFDYLRRSLMCAADTNLEVVGRKTHTTNGWGQEKTCRDYEGVRGFAERWKNSSDVGILSVEMLKGLGEGED